jgi:uncharacterized RDD family membrane protein YckC
MKIFSARETELLRELDGLELAGFWRRAVAFLIDCFLMAVLLSVLTTLGFNGLQNLRQMWGNSGPTEYHLPVVKELRVPITHGGMKLQLIDIEGNEVIRVAATVVVPVLYCGIFLWAGKGRTPGKRLLKIRVVSLAHRHITLWHAVERALGYGAAALELGFGFVQFFIHPYRRCAQDRLAETIVVTEPSYQSLQQKLSQQQVADDLLHSPPQVVAPAETRTPNWHRANKIAPRRVRMEGGDSGNSAGEKKPCPTKKQKNPLDSDRPSHGRH